MQYFLFCVHTMDMLGKFLKVTQSEENQRTQFPAKYLGFHLAARTTRRDATQVMDVVYAIEKEAIPGMATYTVHLSTGGVSLQGRYFEKERMIFSAVHKSRSKLVCFIYKQGKPHCYALECHVFLFTSKREARCFSAALKSYFFQT